MRKKRSAIIKLSFIVFALIVGVLACFVPMKIAGTFFTFKSFIQDIKLGIDLKGGVYAVYDSADDPDQSNMDSRLESTRLRLLEMMQAEGYTEATVVREGSRLRVEAPDVEDPEALFKILGEPADMVFELYTDQSTPAENPYTGITGKNVVNAQAGTYEGGYGVYLEFDSEGSTLFYNVTNENVGKFICIKVNGEIKSTATINEAIAGGRPVISGNFDYTTADTLAKQILSGAFDIKLKMVESDVISASLGVDALKFSLIAGIIGIAVVMIFMGVIYRGMGLVANISLLFYTIMLITLLWSFPWIQLSLPGIAGIILSLGMAVDANVIIFERIKEEYRLGKSINASVAAGYRKSLWTVLDANITTVLAAIVLILLGRGTIQGFGITLLMGIILSVVCGLLVSRGITSVFLQLNKTNNKFYGLFRDTEPGAEIDDAAGGGKKTEEKVVDAEIIEEGGQA